MRILSCVLLAASLAACSSKPSSKELLIDRN